RHSYLGEDLTGLQGGGQHIDKEVLGFEGPFSTRSHRLYVRLQGQDSGWIVRGRVGVGETAAQGATVADLHVANTGCALSQQRALLLEQRRAFHLIVSGQRA